MFISPDNLKDLSEVFTGMAIVLVPIAARYVKKKFEASNFTKKKLDIASLVSERLSEIRVRNSIDRLGIVEFSNGDKSVSGFPFLFVTMTYEKCGANISGMSHLINKVPASWYIDFNKHFNDNSVSYGFFKDNGVCKIGESEAFMNPETAAILKGFGVKCMWTFKIGKNISLGLLNIAFIDDHTVFTSEEIQAILGDCTYIGNLFNQRPQ